MVRRSGVEGADARAPVAMYRRNRRLGRAAVATLLGGLVLLVLAGIGLSTNGFGGLLGDQPLELGIADVLEVRLPSVVVLVAAGLLWAAFTATVVGIEVAFASQVLAAKRRRMPASLVAAATA